MNTGTEFNILSLLPIKYAHECIEKGHTLRSCKLLYLPGGYLTSNKDFYKRLEYLLLDYLQYNHELTSQFFSQVNYIELIDKLYIQGIEDRILGSKLRSRDRLIKLELENYLKRRLFIFATAFLTDDVTMEKVLSVILQDTNKDSNLYRKKIQQFQELLYTQIYRYWGEEFFHPGFLITQKGNIKLSCKEEIHQYWEKNL